MPASNPEIDKLEDSIRRGDQNAVDRLVEKHKPKDMSHREQVAFLEALKRGRYFQALENAARKNMEAGFSHPRVDKLYAQALIDQGDLDHAQQILENVDKKIDWQHPEKNEITGLLGRVFKQNFVLSGKTLTLEKSISIYKQAWERKLSDYRWNGINYIALLARLDRDNATNLNSQTISSLSLQLIDEIEELEFNKQATSWDYGTAMEASIALGNNEDTFYWAGKYLKHPYTDAFALAGTIRQLVEIWQYEYSDTEKRLLPVLQYALTQTPGSGLNISQVKFHDGAGFEAIYGNEGPTRLEFLKTLVNKCRAIVKIVKRGSGAGIGSGFVIRGSDLYSDWDDEPVLVTNSHVISDEAADVKAYYPDQVNIEFTEIDQRPRYAIGQRLFYSKKQELDIWISKIGTSQLTDTLGVSSYTPVVPVDPESVERVYVAGYPRGGDLYVSMYDNDLVKIDYPFVHYKSPTDRGSSGGPAMNAELDAFAVHHRKRDESNVNEGILISEIQKWISQV